MEKAANDIEETFLQFMSTEEGKNEILNPPNHLHILKHRVFLSKEINYRVNLRIRKYLKSDSVSQKFERMKKKIISFYQKTTSELYVIESVWTNESIENDPDAKNSNQDFLNIITHPAGYLLLAASVTFGIAFIGITLAISPVVVPVIAYISSDRRKQRIIDVEYDRYKSSIQGNIRKHLASNHSKVISKLLKKVMDNLHSKQIQPLQMRLQRILVSRQEIIANFELYTDLRMEVNLMMENTRKIQHQLAEGNLDKV